MQKTIAQNVKARTTLHHLQHEIINSFEGTVLPGLIWYKSSSMRSTIDSGENAVVLQCYLPGYRVIATCTLLVSTVCLVETNACFLRCILPAVLKV